MTKKPDLPRLTQTELAQFAFVISYLLLKVHPRDALETVQIQMKLLQQEVGTLEKT